MTRRDIAIEQFQIMEGADEDQQHACTVNEKGELLHGVKYGNDPWHLTMTPFLEDSRRPYPRI